jgi:hypothetical protein
MQICGFCRKPFLKGCSRVTFTLRFPIVDLFLETSYKRHVLYCRRTQHRPRTRARACRACNLAKVKCNLQSRCSRCLSKNLQCVYDAATATIAASDCDQVVDKGQPRDGTQASTRVSLTDDNVPEIASDVYAFGETPIDMDWDAFDFDNNDILSQSHKGAFLHPSGPAAEDLMTEPFLQDFCDLDANSYNGGLQLAELSWLERDRSQGEYAPTAV